MTLVDSRTHYLNSIQLHRTVHTPLSDLQTPYQKLGHRFNFRFLQTKIDFDRSLLPRWSETVTVPTEAGPLPFDSLCLCTGATSPPLESASDPDVIGQSLWPLDYMKAHSLNTALAEMLEKSAAGTEDRPCTISVVGGGATGIQFLFELREYLSASKRPYALQLVDLEPQVLTGMPNGFADYVQKRMRDHEIAYHPGVRFERQDGRQLHGVSVADPESRITLRSDLTLLCPGVRGAPFPMRTNAHGQLEIAGETLPNIYAAGDCAHYDAGGMNAPAAQAAVRKGRLIAENIQRGLRGESLHSYSYPELGYFVSMGPWDGIGWMLVRWNVLRGLPAFAVKEAIEFQFKLFVEGFDTYVDFA